MPLTFLNPGEKGTVRKVSGSADVRRFLENLGFVEGTEVSVVSAFDGNVIVNIKDSRIAINQDMAKNIQVL